MLGVRIPPGPAFYSYDNSLKKSIFKGSHLEWQKVTKPDMKEVQGSTITVIVATALLGLYIGIVDGNPVFPKWESPLSWIFLVALPIGVFFIVKSWEDHSQNDRNPEAVIDSNQEGDRRSGRQLPSNCGTCKPIRLQ